jgi:DNA end-binding protein Ku
MPARATWKGHLRISLVSIPVQVFPATESSASISFNQLHAACQTRIQQKRWCPTCNTEVPYSDIVKGYEFEKGRYVVVTPDDLDQVRPESTRVIDLVQFADEKDIDPIYVDRAYYLAPEGSVAAQSFTVMREGMAGKVGIGKLAISGREYLVAIRPQDQGFVMYTLHHAAEVRPMSAIDELKNLPREVKADEIKLARQVISAFDRQLDLSTYHDEYREGLQRIIDAKIKGEQIVTPQAEALPNVVNLMDALKKSLNAVSAAKKPAAKVALPKTAVRRRKTG